MSSTRPVKIHDVEDVELLETKRVEGNGLLYKYMRGIFFAHHSYYVYV